MPVLSISTISEERHRERMTLARSAYLEDRFDESVKLSVDVYLDVLRANPDALQGSRLDRMNRFGAFPDYGITLANVGAPELDAVYDGRAHTMASAVCYFEYVLEVTILAEERARADATS